MNWIHVDVDEALELLKKADVEADAYYQYIKSAQALSDTIAACWKGNSGEALQEQLDNWMSAQKASVSKIRQNIVELRAALENLQNTDGALAVGISGGNHHSGGGRRG